MNHTVGQERIAMCSEITLELVTTANNTDLCGPGVNKAELGLTSEAKRKLLTLG